MQTSKVQGVHRDKQNNNRCDKCSVVFRPERTLESHRAGQCRKWQDMTAEEQAKLRRKRETNANSAGRKSLGVEQVRRHTWQTTSSCCGVQVPGNDGLYGRSFDKRNKQTTGNSSKHNGFSEQTWAGDLAAS